MISDNIKITVHIANLAVKQLINNTCQLKGVYNQVCLVWEVCLFISVITSKPNCVSVCAQCVFVAASEEIDIHEALADIMSLKDWANIFANDNNDSDFEGF